MAAMKESTRKIFEFVKAYNNKNMTSADVAEALGMQKRSVDGSFTSFVKKGLGVRVETEVELDDGSHKKVKFLHLTDAGMSFDPDASEEG